MPMPEPKLMCVAGSGSVSATLMLRGACGIYAGVPSLPASPSAGVSTGAYRVALRQRFEFLQHGTGAEDSSMGCCIAPTELQAGMRRL